MINVSSSSVRMLNGCVFLFYKFNLQYFSHFQLIVLTIKQIIFSSSKLKSIRPSLAQQMKLKPKSNSGGEERALRDKDHQNITTEILTLEKVLKCSYYNEVNNLIINVFSDWSDTEREEYKAL